MSAEPLRQRHLRVLRRALLATALAFGFGFALAPFYDVLCEKVFGIRPSQVAGEVTACAGGVVGRARTAGRVRYQHQPGIALAPGCCEEVGQGASLRTEHGGVHCDQ